MDRSSGQGSSPPGFRHGMPSQQTINGKPALANLAAYVEMFRMMAVREELDLERQIEAPAAPSYTLIGETK